MVKEAVQFEAEEEKLTRAEFERRLRQREGGRYDDSQGKMTFRIDQSMEWWIQQRPKYHHQIPNLWGKLDESVDQFASTLRSSPNSLWIYSSGSGTGESTMWRELTRVHPEEFQKLLLHTSRQRRPDSMFAEYVVPEHPLHQALLRICRDATTGNTVNLQNYRSRLQSYGYSLADLEAPIAVGEKTQSLSEWVREVVDLRVFGAEGKRYTQAAGKPMEISLSERLELKDGRVSVFGEFDGQEYLYTPKKEIERRGRLLPTCPDHLTVYPFGSELVLGVSLHEIRRAIAGEYGDTGRITAMAAMPEIALDLVSRDGIGDGIKTVFISPLDTSSSEREARLPDAQD